MPTLRRTHARMCLLALGVTACVLVPESARAESPSEQASVQTSWRMLPPTLSLQPEAGRVFLRVAPEWLPPPDRRLVLPSWSCPARSRPVVCTVVGPPIQLQLEHRSRALGFGVAVLPRAAVAMLRFDPVAPWIR